MLENLKMKRKKERRFFPSPGCLLLVHGAGQEAEEGDEGGIGVEGRQGKGLCVWWRGFGPLPSAFFGGSIIIISGFIMEACCCGHGWTLTTSCAM